MDCGTSVMRLGRAASIQLDASTYDLSVEGTNDEIRYGREQATADYFSIIMHSDPLDQSVPAHGEHETGTADH